MHDLTLLLLNGHHCNIILCALSQCMAVRAVVAPKDFADDVVFYILNVINFFYNNNLKYGNDA